MLCVLFKYCIWWTATGADEKAIKGSLKIMNVYHSLFIQKMHVLGHFTASGLAVSHQSKKKILSKNEKKKFFDTRKTKWFFLFNYSMSASKRNSKKQKQKEEIFLECIISLGTQTMKKKKWDEKSLMKHKSFWMKFFRLKKKKYIFS